EVISEENSLEFGTDKIEMHVGAVQANDRALVVDDLIATSVQLSNLSRRKNLFDVVQILPEWGIGYKVANTTWCDVSCQITKINLYKQIWGAHISRAICWFRIPFAGDGFGSTPEMSKRNLFWVVSQMQAIVERYPCWGDTVEVNTWVSANGKNGMRRDWHIRDSMTGHTTLKATSKWVMMNKLTRKLARIPDEVQTDIEPYFVGRSAIVDEDNSKLPKLPEGQSTCAAKYVRTGLTINVRYNLVFDSFDVVGVECKKSHASWIVLD
ncbi:hypothetical protein ACJX0J_007233, partial [Zea mays]